MPYAIRLQSNGGKLIGYEVFDIDTNERVRAFTYALHTYDEHGVSKALTRALEHASKLNGVSDGTSSQDCTGNSAAQVENSSTSPPVHGREWPTNPNGPEAAIGKRSKPRT